MNKWKEVAELFGLELEEEFRFTSNGNKSVCKFKFTNEGLLYKDINGEGWFSHNDIAILTKLINGTFEVVKLPWKPRKGNHYYYAFKGDSTTFDVDYDLWDNCSLDYALWKIGNCFKTEKEAREKGIPFMKKIIEEFENENKQIFTIEE